MDQICVLVDGVRVYFSPRTGLFLGEFPLDQEYVPQTSPDNAFLGEAWNYTSRPSEFVASPKFVDYLTAFLGLIRVGYIFRFLSFKKFLRWSMPSLKQCRSDAVQILAKRITATYRLMPLLPWRAECLEVCGLFNRWGRNIGLNVKLVIGVRTAPFSGHAWCQLKDIVINDSAIVVNQFTNIFETTQDVP